jgi:hypothetical protein
VDQNHEGMFHKSAVEGVKIERTLHAKSARWSNVLVGEKDSMASLLCFKVCHEGRTRDSADFTAFIKDNVNSSSGDRC